MKKKNESTSQFVVCINNEGYPASLELHKIYRVVPDKDAAADDDLRVRDSPKNYQKYIRRSASLKWPALYITEII